MKRLTVGLFTILFFVITLIGIIPTAKAETAVVGPQCNFAPDAGNYSFWWNSDVEKSENNTIAESFTTTFDKITKVTLKADSLNNFTGVITVAIYKTPELSVPDSGITTRSFSNLGSESQDLEFTFSSPVSVDSSSTYRLTAWLAQPAAPTGTFYWRSTVNSACYSGNAYVNDVSIAAVDMGFAIYGYNNAVPEQESTPAQTDPSTTTTTTTTTTATGEAPASQTDSSIKTPTELKAENVSGAAVPTVKLTWKASTTTDITGYKIFRSTEEKKNFKEIGKVDKAILEYSDATAAAATKYYYFVRAYKSTAQSSSSTTVNLTTETPPVATDLVTTTAATPATAESTTATTPEKNSNWLLIALIFAFVALAGALVFFELKSKKEGKKISPKLFWLIISLMIIIAGVIVWTVISGDNKETETVTKTEEEKTATKVYAPKHEDWAVYRSEKYIFNISNPVDYLLTETGDKSINLAKGDKIMVELYSSDGGTEQDLTSTVALYTDDTKGYMTGGKQESVTIAETTGTKVTGTFGKNGGNRIDAFSGIKGSTTIFIKNDRIFRLNSYDNDDAAAKAIFTDIAADLVF